MKEQRGSKRKGVWTGIGWTDLTKIWEGCRQSLPTRWPVEEKTQLYADLLAGALSTAVPEPLDIESFLAILQNLSLREVSIARTMYETWRNDKGAAGVQSVSA